MSLSDFKSILNQYCQRFGKALPKYSTTRSLASKATPLFSCSLVLFNGQVFESQGTFGNKKGAEQNAARQAILHLRHSFEMQKDGDQTNVSSSMLEKDELNETTCEKQAEQSIEDSSIEDVDATNASVIQPSDSSSPSTSFSTPMPSDTSHPSTPTLTLATSKNKLNEYAQKLHIPLPVYQTSIDPVALGFTSVVTFNGIEYNSKGSFRLKKEAEKSAALEALLVLQNQESSGIGTSMQVLTPSQMPHIEGQSGHIEIQINPTQETLVTSPAVYSNMVQNIVNTPRTAVNIQPTNTPSPQVISFKNLLQEFMQQRRKGDIPKYETIATDNGLFKSTVSFCGKSLECTQCCSSKKEAERCAAREVLVDLGVTDPESLVTKRKVKWESPGSSRGRRNRKRARLDDSYTSSKKIKLESAMIEKEAGDINFLSVGEVWREKGNVAIVGNNKTSFILYCTRVPNSLEVLNTRTMQNQQLEPGHRLIALDAEVFQYKGKLVLQAEHCADVELPEPPDPVLISCGVVMLHQDEHDSLHVEVLLKRYFVSQAFINVKAALAQYFRRASIGHPVPLPVERLTEYIETWKLEEVVAMATMTVSSIKQIFSSYASLWKFKEQWSEIFEPSLPKDLQHLQEKAHEELMLRNANGINITDLENHPWSLPKGNFHHRMLSTGLHIEEPSECASRELSEETGIHLYATDLDNVPYIDLPQHDNLNPHKGDVSRYFLYDYKPSLEEKHMVVCESSTEQMSCSLETNTKDNQDQLLVPSCESENIVNEKVIDDKLLVQPESSHCTSAEIPTTSFQSEGLVDSLMTDKSAPISKKIPSVLEQDLCISESSSSSSSASSLHKTSPLNSLMSNEHEECEVSNADMVPTNSSISHSADTNVGVPSALQDNNEGLTSHDNLQDQSEYPEQRGRKRKLSCDEEENSDSHPGFLPKVAPMFQSPTVKGGSHEESAWFPVEEAVKISPVFAEISDNEIFKTFLKSLTDKHL